MRILFLKNKLFFSLMGLFILLAAIPLFLIQKGEAILYINEKHTFYGDVFFKYFTKMGEEPAYIVILFALLFIRIRHALLIPLLGILVTIVSFSLKSYFSILRPAAFFRQNGSFDQLNLVEGVDLHTAASSFPSGHTMSGFALYGLVAFLVHKKQGYALVLFLTAFLIGLSRVYLVQHFWVDIYAGAIIGLGLAIIVYLLQNQISKDHKYWWNQSIQNLGKKQERV